MKIKIRKTENIVKLEIIVIIGAAHSTYNLKQSIPKNIPIVFHNGSDYDYHFIMKELAEEFKKQFTCLGETTDKYTTFTVPIRKVTRTDKDEEKITKNVSYILQLIGSARFMASSNLVNNISVGINRIQCKLGHDDMKYFLNIKTAKMI